MAKNYGNTRHGESRTRLYFVWMEMLQRCRKQTNRMYPRYGGRGIKVCERWRSSFEAFRDDMGPKPSPSHSIDRINNDGNYELGNCRWATRSEQMRNRRNTRMLEFRGETLCMTEWEERTGIAWRLIKGRLLRGWSVEAALTIKPGTTKRGAWSVDPV